MSAGCLPVLCLRSLSGTQVGGSSVLLMAAIISKVTNAINMENSLLITRPALGLSAARFNHHTHSLDKQSFNHHTAMPANTIQQSANLQIRRLDGWIPSDTVYIHSAVRWTVASFPTGTQPEWVQHETTVWCTVWLHVTLNGQRACVRIKCLLNGTQPFCRQ